MAKRFYELIKYGKLILDVTGTYLEAIPGQGPTPEQPGFPDEPMEISIDNIYLEGYNVIDLVADKIIDELTDIIKKRLTP